MDFRSTPCVFLGYSPHHHGYRCLDLANDKIYIARHVRFNEQLFPFIPPPLTKPPNPTTPYYSTMPIPSPISEPQPNPTPPLDTSNLSPPETQNTTPPETTNPTPETTNPTPPDTSNSTPPATTNPTPPDHQNPTPSETTNPPPTEPTRNRPSNLRPNPKQTNRYNPSSYHTSTEPLEPTSFTVANKSPEWRTAMNEEYSALVKNKTWSLVPRVENTNVIDCKWVYRIKKDQDGKITRYKARLVAKGFHQQAGIDYQETLSPVIKATTIRVILSLAITHKWPLRQLDVQNAFLHGDLKETVYLRQPQGFVDKSRPDHVCLLHKSLYGLKQAPRAWFERLSTALHHIGFTGSKTDPSLFILRNTNTLVYVLVYVDDIIVTGNSPKAIDMVITSLRNTFAIKDLGKLDYFLGLEVVPHGPNAILSQRKYVTDLLTKAGISDCKPVTTPMSSSATLTASDSSPPLADPTVYRQVVGALQYVTLSRPDISFAVNKVCQFMQAPTELHWSAVKRILRYLKGTSHYGLFIRQDSKSTLHAFTDAH